MPSFSRPTSAAPRPSRPSKPSSNPSSRPSAAASASSSAALASSASSRARPASAAIPAPVKKSTFLPAKPSASSPAKNSTPSHQNSYTRRRFVPAHALHLPGSRHAIRQCVFPESSRLFRRVCPRVQTFLPASCRAPCGPPLRHDAAHHSSCPRTRSLLCLPPSSHSLQLSVLPSLSIAHWHVRRFHPDPLFYSHQPRPL